MEIDIFNEIFNRLSEEESEVNFWKNTGENEIMCRSKEVADIVVELLEQATGEKFYAVDDCNLVLVDDDGGGFKVCELYGVGKYTEE